MYLRFVFKTSFILRDLNWVFITWGYFQLTSFSNISFLITGFRISRLQSENMALRQELLWVKESLNEVKSCHQTSLGNNSCKVFDKAKPMGLKKLVNNLETELYEVRSKASRQMVEYTRKIARLQSDLEVSAINQRGMRRKIDQLSEELYFLKGGWVEISPFMWEKYIVNLTVITFLVSTNNKCDRLMISDEGEFSGTETPTEQILHIWTLTTNWFSRVIQHCAVRYDLLTTQKSFLQVVCIPSPLSANLKVNNRIITHDKTLGWISDLCSIYSTLIVKQPTKQLQNSLSYSLLSAGTAGGILS